MNDKIKKITERIAQVVLRFKVPIVVVVIIVTAIAGYYALKIEIDSDLLNSLPENDPTVRLYKKIGDKYGGNNAAMVILETDNVFDTTVLNDVKKITDSLKIIEDISYVTSITSIIDVKSSEFGIEIGDLIDEYDMPNTKEELDSLAERIFQKDMYRGVVVSEDSTSTIIIATLKTDANKQKVAEQIKETVEKINPKEKIWFTGIPFLLNDSNQIILNDLFKLIPIATLLIIIVLFLGFRSLRGVLLPLLTVGIAIIWTLGAISLSGYKLSIISDTIPVILLALGSAYTIHVLNRINETKTKDLSQTLKIALTGIIIPVFLAFITTVFGFVSFVFGAYLVTIKQFGIFTALGITFAFLLSVIFTPALIEIFKITRKQEINPKQSKFITKFLYPLSKKVLEHPKKITAYWLITSIVIGSGIFLIQRKVDMVSYFKKGSPTRTAQELVDSKFGGVSPIFVIFEGDVQSPEFLQLMKETEEFMKSSSKYVSYTFSVADLICQMNEAMGEKYAIPDDRAKIEQLWFLLDGQDVMNQLVSYDLDEAVIQARFASLNTKEGNTFVKQMNTYAQKKSTKDIKIKVTGMPHIYKQLDINLLQSQAISLILAILLMFLTVSITMWSVKCGYLSLIPLTATLVFSFGFMGISGIPLDMATVLVASVTLGVGIDYSVHIISHYREFFDGQNLKEAISKAINISGNAILINVISVTLGFLTLLFSNLAPIRNFGLMMATTMIISGLAAITLLPAAIILTQKRKKK